MQPFWQFAMLFAYHILQDFFEELNPLGDMTEKEINDMLYDGSLLIEPRGVKQASKFVSFLLHV